MKETTKTVSNFAAMDFLFTVIRARFPCRVTLAVDRRIKITVVEEDSGKAGEALQNVS